MHCRNRGGIVRLFEIYSICARARVCVCECVCRALSRLSLFLILHTWYFTLWKSYVRTLAKWECTGIFTLRHDVSNTLTKLQNANTLQYIDKAPKCQYNIKNIFNNGLLTFTLINQLSIAFDKLFTSRVRETVSRFARFEIIRSVLIGWTQRRETLQDTGCTRSF